MERRHYTAFGFLQVEDDAELFLEYWFMHIYVNEEDLYTGVYCGTTANNSFRRNITAQDMTFFIGLVVFLSLYLILFHG